MKSVGLTLALAVMLAAAGCTGESRERAGFEIPAGSEITVEKKDGVVIEGRLVEVRAEEVVLERDGRQTSVRRAEIARIAYANRPDATGTPEPPTGRRVVAKTPGPAPVATPAKKERPALAETPPATPRYREVTIPAGTALQVELRTTVGSESSQVEDAVRATIARAVVVDGIEAVPAGAVVTGSVIEATRSGRVKGRARVAFRFNRLDLPGDAERVAIRTDTVAREAAGTKKEDAAKIGGAAAAGAIIGGIVGGGDGAAKGAAIGGGAGTAAVLSTRGDEVTLPAGTDLSVRLAQPLTLRVRD